MKNKIMTTGFLSIILSLILSFGSSNHSEYSLPDKLAKIPTGIEVTHSKTIVYAISNEKDPEKYGQYKWHYETTVTPTNEDLTITEFGAYLWDGKEWVFRSIYGRPFNSEEFSKWYSCDSAHIKKGKSSTDHNNWSKADQLNGQKIRTLWYFIGINANGQKFKGTAEVTTIGELEK